LMAEPRQRRREIDGQVPREWTPCGDS
jgi:hypothetical protein